MSHPPSASPEEKFANKEFTNLSKIKLKTIVFVTLISFFLCWFVIVLGYIDIGYGDKLSAGRTRNALSTLVSIAVARVLMEQPDMDYLSGLDRKDPKRIYINFDVDRTLYPDTQVKGWMSQGAFNTQIHEWMGSTLFQGERPPQSSHFTGRVYKTARDWKLIERDIGIWDVSRWALKLDYQLKIKLKDGEIIGSFDRPLDFDWPIVGVYDASGRIVLHISIPFSGDLILRGWILSEDRLPKREINQLQSYLRQ